MIQGMEDLVRTTLELTPEAHARIKEYAKQLGRPMSIVLGELVTRAAERVIPPCLDVVTDPKTGKLSLVLNRERFEADRQAKLQALAAQQATANSYTQLPDADLNQV